MVVNAPFKDHIWLCSEWLANASGLRPGDYEGGSEANHRVLIFSSCDVGPKNTYHEGEKAEKRLLWSNELTILPSGNECSTGRAPQMA